MKVSYKWLGGTLVGLAVPFMLIAPVGAVPGPEEVGVVFLGSENQSVSAIDAETGAIRWSSPLGYAIRSSATVTIDVVLIGSGPTLNALNRRDGSTLWTHVTGGEITGDLAVAANTVVASSHDGYIYALAPADVVETAQTILPNDQRGVLLAASR